MNSYVIGCLHLGASGMARHRGFESSEEHDDHLIEMWNSVVPKRSKVFILGDVTMETDKYYWKLDLLNGSKEVVLGNHDLSKHVPELLKYVDKVSGMIDYKGYRLSHAPIHPNEVGFYKGNIHAHIHHVNKLEEVYVKDRYEDRDSIIQPTLHKYINVDAHLIGYKPINFSDLIKLHG